MYARETVIINKSGLQARPAIEFAGMASKFKSVIAIGEVGHPRRVNAKSIETLTAQELFRGKKIQISGEGYDERAAVDSLVSLIESGFGEN